MTATFVIQHIEKLIRDIAASKAVDAGTIGPSTRLLGGTLPIDSLDLAAIVVELETVTGHDPFQAGFVNFQTVSELANLYARDQD